ncbi:hypothetical protein KTQ91_04755, partial [Erysipelatoclostridium ramosum]|nr:hypothetical protein [Thomasclavelia ramosa]
MPIKIVSAIREKDIIITTTEAFCSSILMLILLSALEFYFSIADYTSVYGPLASVVVIMISFHMSFKHDIHANKNCFS